MRGRWPAPEEARDPLMQRAILRFYRWLSGPVRLLGVDPEHFHLLLQLRLRLRFRARRKDGASPWSQVGLVLVCVMMLLFGALVGLGLMLVESAYWRLVIGLSFTMLTVTLNSVSDFGEMMADRSEADLVLPAPVEDRAVLLARMAQLSTTLAMLVICLGAGQLAFGGLHLEQDVAWVPSYAVGLVLVAMLSSFLVVLVYMLALRAVGPGRFKSVLAWLQIALISVFYVGFYVARPLLEQSDLSLADLGGPGDPLHLLWPPCWFAALAEVFAGGRSPGLLTGAGAALIVPPVLLVIALRLASSGYLQALAHRAGGLDHGSQPPPVGLLLRWGRWVCRGPRQLAGYAYVLPLMMRESAFRVRVVPSLVMMVALGVGAMLRGDLLGEWYVGLFPYALIALSSMAQVASRHGETPDGRFLIAPTPASHETQLRIGVIKALVSVSVVFPGLLIMLVVYAVAGAEAVGHALLAWLLALAASLALCQAFQVKAPFSEPIPAKGSADGLVAAMVPLVVAGALTGTHFALARQPTVLIGLGVVAVVLVAHQLRRLERLKPTWRHQLSTA